MQTVPVSYPVFIPDARATLATIQHAEQLGVPAVWGPTVPMANDMIPLMAAAAGCTSQIRLGTAIVPTYPRHPLTLASEALALAALAPGRFNLGIGSSHPFIIESMYGLSFGKPVTHLREYITVLRALLWEGACHFEGEYFQVHAEFPPEVEPPRIPLPISALRPPLFRLAGELADGALAAWCPFNYLVEQALPAMQEGAAKANRPVPPLIAQISIVRHEDPGVVREIGRQSLGMYTTQASAYTKMFEMAGYTIGSDGMPPDELIFDYFISGDDDTILQRMHDARAMGIDELMAYFHPVNDPMAEQVRFMQLLAEFNRQCQN